jgi:hypothetical protein
MPDDYAPTPIDACEAALHRLAGHWDHPGLVAFGPLSPDPAKDVKAILLAALRAAGRPTEGILPFDPGLLRIERHRRSTTQGEATLTYAGRVLGTFGDDGVASDADWTDMARNLLARERRSRGRAAA